MELPEQIRKQSEAVQKLYQEMQGAPEGQTTPAPNEQQDSPDSASNQNQNEATAEQVAASPTPEATFEHKYRTLQGKYNKEIPELQSQVRELMQRNQGLESVVSQVQASATRPTASSTAPAQRLITERDVEEYGDSLDVMRRAAREEAGPLQQRLNQVETMLQQFASTVGPQVQQLSQANARTADQKFWDDLAVQVPNWQAINNDPDFQSWLLDVDPLAGQQRQTFLADAQRRLDTQRVVNFFRTWDPNSGQTTAQTRTPSSPADELARQISPGRGKTTTAPASQDRKMWSSAEIRQFYKDSVSGKYKADERARIESDIFAAQHEGRISA